MIVDAVLPTCASDALVVYWVNDHADQDTLNGERTPGGEVPVPLPITGAYNLGLFAAGGFAFTGPNGTPPSDDCTFFVSGRRWIPNHS